MLMEKIPSLKKEYTTKEDWLVDILTNSNSASSQKSAMKHLEEL